MANFSICYFSVNFYLDKKSCIIPNLEYPTQNLNTFSKYTIYNKTMKEDNLFLFSRIFRFV